MPEITHWRSIAAPMTPLDPVGDTNTPIYKAGELPVGFILLLWDGKQLIGPTRFQIPAAARAFMKHSSVTHFMVIPQPQ